MIGLGTELEAHKREAQDREAQDKENDFFLELVVRALDAFENLFNKLNQDSLDKSTKRAFNSFGAIQRKLRRLLEAQGIKQLEFPAGRAEIGRCKVIETQATDEVEEGTILAVVRGGYRRGEQILRPAEVITASRGQAPAAFPKSDGPDANGTKALDRG
ncbi:heat shock protein GrpE [Thiorhodovibrio winogradskyi]|uniref:Heat shock protein GrpE n=1 Tax=Thiorhodovibrio winogradskyi TaxID=77007 RepID=A0ABZ0S797_9GAMM